MIAGIFLYVLMYVGFVAAAWVTNGVFSYFPKSPEKDSYTLFDSMATLAVFSTLYGVYAYFMAEWLH